MTPQHTIPATQNQDYGFWGTMGHHAPTAWPLAVQAITSATGHTPDAIRTFLDSRYGRHFADDTHNALHAGQDLSTAIGTATRTWGLRRIAPRLSTHTGIPAGTPHLDGFITQANIEADE